MAHIDVKTNKNGRLQAKIMFYGKVADDAADDHNDKVNVVMPVGICADEAQGNDHRQKVSLRDTDHPNKGPQQKETKQRHNNVGKADAAEDLIYRSHITGKQRGAGRNAFYHKSAE